jgi:hypothetical protein
MDSETKRLLKKIKNDYLEDLEDVEKTILCVKLILKLLQSQKLENIDSVVASFIDVCGGYLKMAERYEDLLKTCVESVELAESKASLPYNLFTKSELN